MKIIIDALVWIAFSAHIARCLVFHRGAWQYFDPSGDGIAFISYCPKCRDVRGSHPGLDEGAIVRMAEIMKQYRERTGVELFVK